MSDRETVVTPRRGRSPALLAAALSVAMMAGGCVTTQRDADRDWNAGRWEAAAVAYEAALSGPLRPEHEDLVLFRLGLAYAAPSSPVCNAALARDRLADLLARHPFSSYREPAEVMMQLLDALAAAQKEADAIRDQSAALSLQAETSQNDAKVKETTIGRLRAALAESQAEVAKVREALDQLKHIDLQRRP